MFTGIVPAKSATDLGYLKRLALLFDNISVMGLRELVKRGKTTPDLSAELDYLQEHGFLSHADLPRLASVKAIVERGLVPTLEALDHLSPEQKMEQIFGSHDLARLLTSSSTNPLTDDPITLRALAVWFHSQNRVDAVAVATRYSDVVWDAADKSDVARFVLENIPQPSDLTPWDDIFAYRSDTDVRGKFARLKVWLNRVARAQVPLNEVEDEYNSLLFDYEESLRIAKLKFDKAAIEIVVTGTGELLEDLTHVKVSKLTERPFKAAHERIAMLQEEKNAEGRELAYIVDVKKTFGVLGSEF